MGAVSLEMDHVNTAAAVAMAAIGLVERELRNFRQEFTYSRLRKIDQTL